MTGSADTAGPRPLLVALANLLGNLLLLEVDAALLGQLREPAIAAALAEWGISLPTPDEEPVWIEDRAAEYHDLFLRPEAGPLVQSLWTQGRYEGDAAVRVRALAEAAGAGFDARAARGAPVDHLGSLLLFWAACEGRVQPIADEIARQHLAWALPALKKLAGAPGFYGSVALASEALLCEIGRSSGMTHA